MPPTGGVKSICKANSSMLDTTYGKEKRRPKKKRSGSKRKSSKKRKEKPQTSSTLAQYPHHKYTGNPP